MNDLNPTVVIADDERVITTIIGQRLNQLGLSVRHARDAQRAMELVEELHPDLVLLDVNMPGGGGLAVCEAIKMRADLADIPVVILTGRSDQRTQAKILELQATYIAKSTDMWPRIEACVKRLLAEHVPA